MHPWPIIQSTYTLQGSRQRRGFEMRCDHFALRNRSRRWSHDPRDNRARQEKCDILETMTRCGGKAERGHRRAKKITTLLSGRSLLLSESALRANRAPQEHGDATTLASSSQYHQRNSVFLVRSSRRPFWRSTLSGISHLTVPVRQSLP